MESLREQLRNLSDRERKLLTAMLIVLPLMAMTLVIGVFYNSLTDIEESTQSFQQSLDLVAMAGPTYVEKTQKDRGQTGIRSKFTDEVMTKNELKLTSFVATHAAAVNINVSSYDETKIPIGSKDSKDGPIITERKLKVDIREAQFERLLKLLERIEGSDKPVVIKRIDLRGKSRTPGEVRARIEVSTYVKKEAES